MESQTSSALKMLSLRSWAMTLEQLASNVHTTWFAYCGGCHSDACTIGKVARFFQEGIQDLDSLKICRSEPHLCTMLMPSGKGILWYFLSKNGAARGRGVTAIHVAWSNVLLSFPRRLCYHPDFLISNNLEILLLMVVSGCIAVVCTRRTYDCLSF